MQIQRTVIEASEGRGNSRGKTGGTGTDGDLELGRGGGRERERGTGGRRQNRSSKIERLEEGVEEKEEEDEEGDGGGPEGDDGTSDAGSIEYEFDWGEDEGERETGSGLRHFCCHTIPQALNFSSCSLTVFYGVCLVLSVFGILSLTSEDTRRVPYVHLLFIGCIAVLSRAVFFSVRLLLSALIVHFDPLRRTRTSLYFDTVDPGIFYVLWTVTILVLWDLRELLVSQDTSLLDENEETRRQRMKVEDAVGKVAAVLVVIACRFLLEELLVQVLSLQQAKRRLGDWVKVMRIVHLVQKLSSKIYWHTTVHTSKEKLQSAGRLIKGANFSKSFVKLLDPEKAQDSPTFDVWQIRNTIRGSQFTIFIGEGKFQIKRSRDAFAAAPHLFNALLANEVQRQADILLEQDETKKLDMTGRGTGEGPTNPKVTRDIHPSAFPAPAGGVGGTVTAASSTAAAPTTVIPTLIEVPAPPLVVDPDTDVLVLPAAPAAEPEIAVPQSSPENAEQTQKAATALANLAHTKQAVAHFPAEITSPVQPGLSRPDAPAPLILPTTAINGQPLPLPHDSSGSPAGSPRYDLPLPPMDLSPLSHAEATSLVQDHARPIEPRPSTRVLPNMQEEPQHSAEGALGRGTTMQLGRKRSVDMSTPAAARPRQSIWPFKNSNKNRNSKAPPQGPNAGAGLRRQSSQRGMTPQQQQHRGRAGGWSVFKHKGRSSSAPDAAAPAASTHQVALPIPEHRGSSVPNGHLMQPTIIQLQDVSRRMLQKVGMGFGGGGRGLKGRGDGSHGGSDGSVGQNSQRQRLQAAMCGQYIWLATFQMFLPPSEAEEVMAAFDYTGSGRVSYVKFARSLLFLHFERNNIIKSILSLDSITSLVRQMLGCNLWVITIFIALIVSGVDFSQVLVPMLAVVASISFAFGNSCRNLFDSMAFLFFQHPFDIGDRVSVLGGSVDSLPLMIVKEVHATTTHFVTIFNKRVIIPNFELGRMTVVNESRSPQACFAFGIRVKFDTPPEKLKMVRDFVSIYLRNRSSEWLEEPWFNIGSFAVGHFIHMDIWVTHRLGWDRWKEIYASRMALWDALTLFMNKIGVQYAEPSLPVSLPWDSGASLEASRAVAGDLGLHGPTGVISPNWAGALSSVPGQQPEVWGPEGPPAARQSGSRRTTGGRGVPLQTAATAAGVFARGGLRVDAAQPTWMQPIIPHGGSRGEFLGGVASSPGLSLDGDSAPSGGERQAVSEFDAVPRHSKHRRNLSAGARLAPRKERDRPRDSELFPSPSSAPHETLRASSMDSREMLNRVAPFAMRSPAKQPQSVRTSLHPPHAPNIPGGGQRHLMPSVIRDEVQVPRAGSAGAHSEYVARLRERNDRKMRDQQMVRLERERDRGPMRGTGRYQGSDPLGPISVDGRRSVLDASYPSSGHTQSHLQDTGALDREMLSIQSSPGIHTARQDFPQHRGTRIGLGTTVDQLDVVTHPGEGSPLRDFRVDALSGWGRGGDGGNRRVWGEGTGGAYVRVPSGDEAPEDEEDFV